MRKVNTRGIQQANKVMLMAAMAYNLKKYMKFSRSRVETMVNEVREALSSIFCLKGFNLSH
jgi:hypothetical protein